MTVTGMPTPSPIPRPFFADSERPASTASLLGEGTDVVDEASVTALLVLLVAVEDVELMTVDVAALVRLK